MALWPDWTECWQADATSRTEDTLCQPRLLADCGTASKGLCWHSLTASEHDMSERLDRCNQRSSNLGSSVAILVWDAMQRSSLRLADAVSEKVRTAVGGCQ